MLAFSIAITISLFVFIMMTLIVLRQSDSQREMQRRLDQFMDPSAEEEMVDPDDLRKIPFLQRTVGRVLGDLMDTLSYFAPAAIPKLMERRIMLAGKQGVWKVAHFAGLWFLCLALGLALGFWYAGRGVYTAPQFFLIVLGWGFMGALLPFGVLNHIIKKRQSLITQQLPDVLDLLAISVQAGLSFDAALRKVVERMKGPLIDELSRMLRDVRMGMTRRRSMQFMAKRCDDEGDEGAGQDGLPARILHFPCDLRGGAPAIAPLSHGNHGEKITDSVSWQLFFSQGMYKPWRSDADGSREVPASSQSRMRVTIFPKELL